MTLAVKQPLRWTEGADMVLNSEKWQAESIRQQKRAERSPKPTLRFEAEPFSPARKAGRSRQRVTPGFEPGGGKAQLFKQRYEAAVADGGARRSSSRARSRPQRLGFETNN